MRLELQQAHEWLRTVWTSSAQAVGILLTANATLLAFGLINRKALLILFAAFTVVGIIFVLRVSLRQMMIVGGVGIRLEYILTRREQGLLVSTMAFLERAIIPEELAHVARTGTDEELVGLITKAAVIWNIWKSFSGVGLLFMLAIQVGLLVATLTVFNFPWT